MSKEFNYRTVPEASVTVNKELVPPKCHDVYPQHNSESDENTTTQQNILILILCGILKSTQQHLNLFHTTPLFEICTVCMKSKNVVLLVGKLLLAKILLLIPFPTYFSTNQMF